MLFHKIIDVDTNVSDWHGRYLHLAVPSEIVDTGMDLTTWSVLKVLQVVENHFK